VTEPFVPPAENVPRAAQGDESTSLWGGLFLPMGQGPASPAPVPLPSWGPHAELLRDADPARFYAVDFLVWTLQFNFGNRLASEGDRAAIAIPQAVQSVGLADPIPFMSTSSSEFSFPLLAVYRRKSKSDYVTTTYHYREQEWEIRYVLPGMGYEAASRLIPIFEAAQASVDEMVSHGYHPQYAPPGGKPGDLVFQKAGMMEVETGESAWEYFDPDGAGIVHPMLRMEWAVKVRKMDVRTVQGQPAVRGAPVPLAGLDVTSAVSAEGGDPAGESPIPVARFRTDATVHNP
jgi:hypothetical protein